MKKQIQNILILIFALSVIASIFFYVEKNIHWWSYVVVFIAIGLVYNTSAVLINRLLDKYFPWETTPNRIYITVFSYLFVMLILSIILPYLVANYFSTKPFTFYQFIHSPNSFFTIFGYYMLSLVFTFFFLSKGLYESLVATKLKEKELIEAKNKSEIQALKNQLDPHFLFNNLSVLHSLIEENPAQAQEFIENITENYRDVMEAQKKELSSVEEDLQVAINYFNVLKIRLGNTIELKLSDELKLEKKILPLSIQMAIENAVKHNAATEENPLIIIISSETDFIKIENNKNPKNTIASSKIGLANLKSRYQLYNKKLLIEDGQKTFVIKIPYI